jgi:hypothetical protein
MLKRDECAVRTSYLNKADDDEMMFVLLARDRAAPDTIRGWCIKRISLGLNTMNDEQIICALQCATDMEIHQTQKRKKVK